MVYLDSAATAQKPLAVMEAMDAVMTAGNANIHRAEHALAVEVTAGYEAARDTVARFIGAGAREEVVFTAGATMGLNMVARGLAAGFEGFKGLSSGDNVVVSALEHHSNIVPWMMTGAEIRVLEFGEGGLPDPAAFEKLIDRRTRVLAVTQCSNVLGTKPDVRKLAEIAHAHGVLVVVDGCQGVVHGGVDVRELGADFYAFSGHKLYGPTGIGVLWGRRELLEKLPPMMGGGDMVAPGGVSFGRPMRYAELPFRHEAGTANYIGAIGLGAAVEWLEQLNGTAEWERFLLRRAVEELQKIEGLTIYGRGEAPIVAFSVEGVHAGDLGAILDKQGVAVRTGMLCAQPLVERLGLRSVCRASFGLYNTEDEVVRLAASIERARGMLLCR